jgi:hypothetical protein
MSPLESLPADQRAVLELVLKQGRGYDDIARVLSVDRAGVRERALAALDTLGPRTRVPQERRALITDYVLGQLPPRVAEDTRRRLSQSASERAWARVLASELAPLASKPLPDIPAEAAAPEPEPAAGPGASVTGRVPDAAPEPVLAATTPAASPDAGGEPPAPEERPSSRRGGIILLSLGALVVAGVVVAIILITSNNSGSNSSSTAASQPAATTPATSSATTPSTATSTPNSSTTSTNGAHLVAQINMISPSKSSKAVGVALVLKQGKNTGIAIRAQNLPANGKHDAYAVWLYKSAQDSHILGFVNPSVGSNGVLQAESGLPSNAGHFKQLLITKENQQHPNGPGTIVLRGQLKGL